MFSRPPRVFRSMTGGKCARKGRDSSPPPPQNEIGQPNLHLLRDDAQAARDAIGQMSGTSAGTVCNWIAPAGDAGRRRIAAAPEVAPNRVARSFDPLRAGDVSQEFVTAPPNWEAAAIAGLSRLSWASQTPCEVRTDPCSSLCRH